MTIDLPIPEELRHTFSPRIASKLRAWAPVDLEQYMALTVTQHLKEGAAVSNSDFFFRLQVFDDTHLYLLTIQNNFFSFVKYRKYLLQSEFYKTFFPDKS